MKHHEKFVLYVHFRMNLKATLASTRVGDFTLLEQVWSFLEPAS